MSDTTTTPIEPELAEVIDIINPLVEDTFAGIQNAMRAGKMVYTIPKEEIRKYHPMLYGMFVENLEKNGFTVNVLDNGDNLLEWKAPE